MATDSEVRQRKPAGEKQPEEKKARSKAQAEDDNSSRLDILRVLTFLFVASCGLSYVISSGESLFWGMKDKPYYLQTSWWQSKLNGPVYMTLEELAAYDGKDESKPVYLAINNTIYDVSSGRRMYGAGGSYNFFAGKDASRAFVSSCFEEDLIGDTRGLEEMYLPLDDAKIDSQWTSTEMAKLKEAEMERAKERVYEGYSHWVNFFANSKKYSFVGYVKRPKGWPANEPIKKLCDKNQKARKPREAREDGK